MDSDLEPEPDPPRRYHHGAVRETVLAAALERVARAGPDALSLRQLARDAGVSHTAVGKEFGGLPALVAATAIAIYLRLDQALKPTDPALGPLDAFREMGRAYIRFAVEHPGWMQFLGHPSLAALRDDAGFVTAANLPYSRVRDAIRRCCEAGVVRDDPPEQLAMLAWLAVHGFAMSVGAGDPLMVFVRAGQEPETAADLLLDQIYLGLRPLDGPHPQRRPPAA